MAKQVKNGKREFYVIIEEGEDGYYIAEVPELRGCYTQAQNLDQLMDRVKEVIQLCLEDEVSKTKNISRTKIVGIQKISI